MKLVVQLWRMIYATQVGLSYVEIIIFFTFTWGHFMYPLWTCYVREARLFILILRLVIWKLGKFFQLQSTSNFQQQKSGHIEVLSCLIEQDVSLSCVLLYYSRVSSLITSLCVLTYTANRCLKIDRQFLRFFYARQIVNMVLRWL